MKINFWLNGAKKEAETVSYTHLEGCPPTEEEIYEFLKIYLIG